MKSPPPAAALGLLLLLPTGGCCSLARLFCGPDRSPWVSVSYRTAEETLRTFLEALRRDDREQVYLCLSPGFKAKNGLTSVSSNAAWEKLTEQVPHLHMAGYAEVPAAPARATDGGVSYELDVHGYRLVVDLARTTRQLVRYRDREGRLHEPSAVVEDSLNGLVGVKGEGVDVDEVPQSRVSILDFAMLTSHPYDAELRVDQIDAIGFVREWKIANLVLPQQ